jgi:annexin A7/11
VFKTPVQFDADLLANAMKGLGTDDTCLIDVLVTRSFAEKQQMDQVFNQQHNHSLHVRSHSENATDRYSGRLVG